GRRDRLCRNHPREYDKPRRRHAAAARHGTGYHRRILPGERLPAIRVVRSAADALDLRAHHGFHLYVPCAVRRPRRDVDARTLRPWHTARTATRFYPPPHNPQAMFKELNPLLHSE